MARQEKRRHWLRRMLGVGVLAGAAYAVWRAIEANRVAGKPAWESQPFPFPPQPATTEEPTWKPPVDGRCPGTHPVKAKESSRIFHVPGGQSYARTMPDRCYSDPAAAEADGFRPAKR